MNEKYVLCIMLLIIDGLGSDWEAKEREVGFWS